MQKSQIGTIQALRALAAVLIVLCHIPEIGIGAFGVDIFFTISGFIMCYVADNGETNFFARRIFRIVPLYWAATLSLFLVANFTRDLLKTSDTSLLDLFRSLFFIPYVRPNGLVQPILFLGWTLNFEMFFYLVFAASISINRRYAPLICSTAILFGCAFVWIAHAGAPWSGWLGLQALEFVGGMFLYSLLRQRPLNARIPRGGLIGTAAASLVGLIIYSYVDTQQTHVLVCGPLSMILFFSVSGMEGRIAIPKAILSIGNASYSLYLLHPYVLRSFEAIFHRLNYGAHETFVMAIFAGAISIGVALLSFHYIEKPSNDFLKSTFLKRIPVSPAAHPAALDEK
jgi:peptidoglycan/LPS O-acetylase OafA/YrhL